LKNGADKFQGELIHFGSDKFPNWNIDDEFRPLRDEMMKTTDISEDTP